MGGLTEKPVKLPIKPKACKHCGKPFIPTSPNNVYCPACKELTQGKRNRSLFAKHAEEVFGPGPWSNDRIEMDDLDKNAKEHLLRAGLPFDIQRVMAIGEELLPFFASRSAGVVDVTVHLNDEKYEYEPSIQLTEGRFLEVFGKLPYKVDGDRLRAKIGDVNFVAVIHTEADK